ISAPGTTPGLDLDNLLHMHMQLDPAEFGEMGAYTVEWKNLNLIEVEVTPGDFDADGDVDGSDFLIWQRDTTVGDLGDWEANFGTMMAAGQGSLRSVPEPASLMLLCIGWMGLWSVRRA